jgi:hypothetical protein
MDLLARSVGSSKHLELIVARGTLRQSTPAADQQSEKDLDPILAAGIEVHP